MYFSLRYKCSMWKVRCPVRTVCGGESYLSGETVGGPQLQDLLYLPSHLCRF